MGVRTRNEFYSLNGTQYRVEIHDSDWGGTTTTTYKDGGFEITWDDENDNFLDTIKASSCRYILFDDGGGTFSAMKNDIASAQEDEFKLVIYKYSGGWNLYWVGVIMADMVQWRNESAPREFEIIAKDGLNRIKTIPFTNINSSPFTIDPQTFMYIIEKCLAKNGLASFHSGDYIKVSQDWYETQMTSTNPQRVFERVRLWGDNLRKDIKDDQTKTTNVDPMYCGEVLDGVLKLFGCRILYSDGCYHIQQVSNFISTTYNEADYDSSGTYVTMNSSVSNTITAYTSTTGTQSDLRLMDNGIFGYHAAYKRCKLTARGYLDVRGAYIDEVLVNKSDRTETVTLQLGTIIGGVYATASKTTSGNTNTFKARNGGTIGNNISLVFDGVKTAIQIVDDWNTANPTNQVYITSGLNSTVHSAGTTTLSGGAGNGNRILEIAFDADVYTTSQTLGSNILTTIDVKLICGSYRIKNRPGLTNQGVCDWSTTATDKWSYTIEGYRLDTQKISLKTDEIPFAKETSCTCEITITLTKKNGASWTSAGVGIFPQRDDEFYSRIRRGRVIAWDGDIDTLADAEVIVENPTNTENSVEFDYGTILIGDNPIVQRSISSKNSFEVLSSGSTWERPNIWDASFDTDYNLVTTMLFEAMALRKSPIYKYMGGFVGSYSPHKSITYDGSQWVLNSVKYDANTDEWNGSWFAVTYSQSSIVQSEQRLKPGTDIFGIPPTRVKDIPTKDNIPMPINPKGKGAIPYTPGMGTINAIETDSLDNNHFRLGDSMMVYHPTTQELLHQFVVDADTIVSDTSITVVSDTPDRDIPVGSLLEHNSKEVVESETIRTENLVYLGATWSKTVYLTESDFASSIYTLNGTEGITLVNISGGGLYYVDLPLVANSEKNGCGLDLIVKHLAGSFEVRVPAGDSGVYIKTIQSSTLTSLAVTGGASLRLVYDVENGHWQRISI